MTASERSTIRLQTIEAAVFSVGAAGHPANALRKYVARATAGSLAGHSLRCRTLYTCHVIADGVTAPDGRAALLNDATAYR